LAQLHFQLDWYWENWSFNNVPRCLFSLGSDETLQRLHGDYYCTQ